MKLLVTGAWKHTQSQLQHITNLGYQVVEMPDERGDIPCDCSQVDAVICNGLFLYHPIEKFTSLKFVQLTSAGYDRMPMDYAQAHGIKVYNAAGVYSIPMAEFAVSSVLQFYKQARFFYKNQEERRWEKHRGLRELFGKSVLIVGCGSVGAECAKRFQAFGCEVVGVNRTPKEDKWFDVILPMSELENKIGEADVVVIAVALAEETNHLFDRMLLSKMKPGCVLINLSRGPIVDTVALVDVLREHELYAALDAFDEEPLCVDSQLWGMGHVTITPHNCFVGEKNGDRLMDIILGNLRK